MRVASSVLSLLLIPCIVLSPLWAQMNPAVPAQAGAQAPLQLHVVDDPGGALANSTAAKGYILQVSDPSGNPVSSAAVALRLPEDGPTGRFTNGLRAWVAYTNSAGIASFPVIHWLESAGSAELRITAAKASMHAGLVIQQQIQPDHPALAVVAPLPPFALPAPDLRPTIPTGAPPVYPAPSPMPKISLQTPAPGTVFAPLPDVAAPTVSKSGAAAPKDALIPNPPPPGDPNREQTVSIVDLKTGAGGSGHSNKKWLIIAAVGAGAGVGIMLALKGHGAGTGSSTSTAGLSIGTPTISVGH